MTVISHMWYHSMISHISLWYHIQDCDITWPKVPDADASLPVRRLHWARARPGPAPNLNPCLRVQVKNWTVGRYLRHCHATVSRGWSSSWLGCHSPSHWHMIPDSDDDDSVWPTVTQPRSRCHSCPLGSQTSAAVSCAGRSSTSTSRRGIWFLCLITIKLNSISQSDQSSRMTFYESLCSDRK